MQASCLSWQRAEIKDKTVQSQLPNKKLNFSSIDTPLLFLK